MHRRGVARLLFTSAVMAAWGAWSAPPAPAQDLSQLTGEQQHPLQVTGFGVGDYSYDGRTHDNTFAASKLALSVFHEVSDQVWVFGQLTTSDETEIDNLIVSWTPPGAPALNFSAGKFDSPIGFERDDEPLNLQPTRSFVAELARPTKLVGLVGRWAASPRVDVTALLSNGWDADESPAHGKTGGARLGWLPVDGASLGLAALYGPNGEPDSTRDRYVVTMDYAFQPTDDWILAGEGDWGGDRDALADGGDARWYGGSLSVFRRFGQNLGALLRAEVLRDRDGARTGTPQTLESYTVAPLYFLGAGREGIFANIEHTTFRLPRLQLRAEARLDHSDVAVFDTEEGLDTWRVRYVIQLVTLF